MRNPVRDKLRNRGKERENNGIHEVAQHEDTRKGCVREIWGEAGSNMRSISVFSTTELLFMYTPIPRYYLLPGKVSGSWICQLEVLSI